MNLLSLRNSNYFQKREDYKLKKNFKKNLKNKKKRI